MVTSDKVGLLNSLEAIRCALRRSLGITYATSARSADLRMVSVDLVCDFEVFVVAKNVEVDAQGSNRRPFALARLVPQLEMEVKRS